MAWNVATLFYWGGIRPGPRRRLALALTRGELLEPRQLLVAGWSDSLLVGPIYSPQSEILATAETAAPSETHDHDYPAEPHSTPLPKDWQPPGARRKPRPGEVLHPLTDLPQLNSFPEATVHLFLDFDGHLQDNWGGRDRILTPAYSADNDPTTFTDAELADIAEIFARVSEDFAPFNINVTTVEPADLGDGVGVRVAIGGRWEDWYNAPVGGIAFLDSFTNSLPNTVYTFAETLAVPKTIAEASSHEAGHAFGLSHQSEYDDEGRKVDEYYAGDFTGAPIMGLSYIKNRSRWWLGTSISAETIQDDLAVLTRAENGFGYRIDDYGGTFDTSQTLSFVDNRALLGGIVEQMDDADVFRFDVSATEQYRIDYHAAAIAANLDIQLEIRMQDGSLVEQRTTFHNDSLALGITIEPGTYQVIIRSNGTYGSLGRYTLQVTQGNDPSLPPTTPGDFEGVYLSPASVSFDWVDALGETHYVLHARRGFGKKAESFTVSIPSDSSSYILSSFGPLDGYEFELEAVNGVGSNVSEKITPDELPLTAPQNVQVSQFALSSLSVRWDAVPGAFAYLVRIATAADPGTLLQDVFVDGLRTETVLSGVQPGIEYLVTVTARNSLGDVSQTPISAQIVDVPNAAPILPPAPVRATAVSRFTVEVSWPAVSGATLYQVQQRRGKEWIVIKVVAASEQQVSVLPDGDRHRLQFRVVAANGAQSATSKPVKVRRPRS